MSLTHFGFAAHNQFTGATIETCGGVSPFDGTIADGIFTTPDRCPNQVEFDPGMPLMTWDFQTCYLGYESVTYKWNVVGAWVYAAIRQYYEAHFGKFVYSGTEPVLPDQPSWSRYWLWHFDGEKGTYRLTSGVMSPPDQEAFLGGADVIQGFSVKFTKLGFHLNEAQTADVVPQNIGYDWFDAGSYAFEVGNSDG